MSVCFHDSCYLHSFSCFFTYGRDISTSLLAPQAVGQRDSIDVAIKGAGRAPHNIGKLECRFTCPFLNICGMSDYQFVAAIICDGFSYHRRS